MEKVNDMMREYSNRKGNRYLQELKEANIRLSECDEKIFALKKKIEELNFEISSAINKQTNGKLNILDESFEKGFSDEFLEFLQNNYPYLHKAYIDLKYLSFYNMESNVRGEKYDKEQVLRQIKKVANEYVLKFKLKDREELDAKTKEKRKLEKEINDLSIERLYITQYIFYLQGIISNTNIDEVSDSLTYEDLQKLLLGNPKYRVIRFSIPNVYMGKGDIENSFISYTTRNIIALVSKKIEFEPYYQDIKSFEDLRKATANKPSEEILDILNSEDIIIVQDDFYNYIQYLSKPGKFITKFKTANLEHLMGGFDKVKTLK